MTAPTGSPAELSYGTRHPIMRVAFQHSIGWDFRYLIARGTGRPVHVATIYDDDLYEAAWGGMRRLTAVSRLADGNWEIFDVPLKYNTTAGLQLATSRIKWRYDWIGAMIGWWAGRIAGAVMPNRVFCSDEGADELLHAGVPLLYHRTAHYTPRSLRDELVKRHGWTSYRLHDGERVA